MLLTLKRAALAVFTALMAWPVASAPVDFAGTLDVVLLDNGGIYSGVGVGTPFSGTIDDPGGFGSITGAGIKTDFTCCIFAGLNEGEADIGLELDNDVTLDASTAATLNTLFGAGAFMTGQIVDIVDLEGDEASTAGRIEIGLSYLFDAGTYVATDTPDLGADAEGALAGLFFIAEFDATENELYSAVGALSSPAAIPTPSAFVLLLSTLALGGTLMRGRLRRRSGALIGLAAALGMAGENAVQARTLSFDFEATVLSSDFSTAIWTAGDMLEGSFSLTDLDGTPDTTFPGFAEYLGGVEIIVESIPGAVFRESSHQWIDDNPFAPAGVVLNDGYFSARAHLVPDGGTWAQFVFFDVHDEWGTDIGEAYDALASGDLARLLPRLVIQSYDAASGLGTCDLVDVSACQFGVQLNGLTLTGDTASPTVIPAPASLPLLATALASAALWRRRTRTAAGI